MPNGVYKCPNSSFVYVTDQGKNTKAAGVYQWELSNNQTRLIVGHYQSKVVNSQNDIALSISGKRLMVSDTSHTLGNRSCDPKGHRSGEDHTTV